MQNPDALLRYSRLSLWSALVIVAMVGTLMSLQLLGSRSVVTATRYGLALLPIVIAIVAGSLVTMWRARGKEARAALRALLDDELRQQALSKAYRNAFAACLTSGAVVMPFLQVYEVQQGAAAVYVVIATVGMITLLGSVLYYDR